MPQAGHWYLLIDEVQLIDGWERVINAIRVDHDVDIIVTGSNAHLLSGQLATLLSGRAMAIRMYPLSFREFMDYTGITDRTEAFERYIRYGGLPPVVDQGANQAPPVRCSRASTTLCWCAMWPHICRSATPWH